MKDKRIDRKLLHVISKALDGRWKVTIYKKLVFIHAAGVSGELVLSLTAIGHELGYGGWKRADAGRKMALRLIRSGRLPAKQVSPNKWAVAASDLKRLREMRLKQHQVA